MIKTLFSREELQNCLRRQITTLGDAGFPQSVVEDAQEFMELLPSQLEMTHGLNGQALLLVVPLLLVNFKRQMELTRYRPPHDSRGQAVPVYSFLTLEGYEAPIVSSRPYVVLDVIDGTDTRGFCPVDAKRFHYEKSRHSFDVEQCLALVRHFPDVFDRHNIYAAGSLLRRDGTEYTPDFWVYGGEVKMKRDSRQKGDPRWGTPSYGRAITL